MDEEEEGKRTVEDKYKELAAHFASISLITPLLNAHKIIHFDNTDFVTHVMAPLSDRIVVSSHAYRTTNSRWISAGCGEILVTSHQEGVRGLQILDTR